VLDSRQPPSMYNFNFLGVSLMILAF